MGHCINGQPNAAAHDVAHMLVLAESDAVCLATWGGRIRITSW
jgi:hypothetical protein